MNRKLKRRWQLWELQLYHAKEETCMQLAR